MREEKKANQPAFFNQEFEVLSSIGEKCVIFLKDFQYLDSGCDCCIKINGEKMSRLKRSVDWI